MQLFQSKNIQAFFSLKSGHKILKKLVNLNENDLSSDNYSKYLFLQGLYKIGLTILPTQYVKIWEFFGLIGNKEEGVFYLKECEKNKGIREKYSFTDNFFVLLSFRRKSSKFFFIY